VCVVLLQWALAGPSLAEDQLGKSAASYRDWKHAGSLFVLTTPEGANLPESAVVEGFPLLVRLHRDFFDFSQAQPVGADLRFSSSTGEPLPYQIEEWDAAQGVASIWVRVPKITGNSRQEIHLHWGKADAASESSGKAVFNDSNSYVSVWHMHETVLDEVGTLPSDDKGTTPTAGMIGAARHFPGQKGVFCGDMIPDYPSADSSHSTEAWFRIEQPNATIIGWGNEGGGRGSKVRMQFRSPPHLHIDSDFSDVNGDGQLKLGEWIHVVHTYDREDGRIYINGKLDGAAKPLLNIKTPSRLWLGGWYHNYDFVGDMDEVRISKVARSPEWIKLQYENQKPGQTLVGPVVQPGSALSVSSERLALKEGESAMVTAKAGGAQKVSWILKREGRETVVATDRFSYQFEAGRIVDHRNATLIVKAVYPTDVKTIEIPISIAEAIPEPVFTLSAPITWNGREIIEVVPQIANLKEMQAAGAGELKFAWTVDDVAVIKQIVPGKLILKRAQGSGPMRVSVAIDNGGAKITQSVMISVKEPPAIQEPWVARPLTANEQPEANQFIARDTETGTLAYTGTLTEAADSVFVRVFADDKPFATEVGKLTAEKTYSLAVSLKPGLIKYRTEFGTKTGDKETVLHTASNIVCGDVYLIDGQSNAVATDIGPEDPTFTSDWIRTFGSTTGDPNHSRQKLWGNAIARSRDAGKREIGYWGMELGKRLIESQKMPVCIINGAVGGSRIDQHQRSESAPTDASTIYGRLLWRVREAKLTHGVRAVLWHQGENDQGADGPTGGYGFETYRQFFVDMSAGWKTDYPNVQHYYVFQIWPKACSMGINGSDNKLREVQRTLPRLYSNLRVIPTLGIKPPGGCHYPKEGYAEFARLLSPLIENDLYQRAPRQPFMAPDLKRAYFTSDSRVELVLEFDSPVVWADPLTSQFFLDGAAKQVASGSASENRLTLKLVGPSKATKITYLDSAAWNPDNLLWGRSGLAALTFCDVPIESSPSAQLP
jgi:Concanavalin A-like lectin/glucanases superfamily/Domain of unknown function (DUF2341)/Carbohydrate esterase, sialic acid-specific acetylesterase